ncbi:MAG: stage II sporulation protein M [Gemmatimonadales bacterium]
MSTLPPPVDFSQHLAVETPENVVVEVEIAGLGSRALAATLDMLILGIWTWAFFRVVGAVFGGTGSGWIEAVLILVNFAGYWAYFTLFEGLRQGQTPGKRAAGIRVIRDTGHGVSFSAAALRNLLRIADFLPPPYLTGLLLVLFHPRGKRLGDIVAGTVVVRDRPAETAGLVPPAGADTMPDAAIGAPELTDEEFRVLREFMDRAGSLDPEARTRLTDRLVERFAPRYPTRPGNNQVFLARLLRDELARRSSRYVTHRRGGGLAERFASRKQERWNEFQRLADRAARKGLDDFNAAELPDFAARYREVAADLARARTYDAPPAVIFRLERLVTAGHNALYRDERRPLARVAHMALRECPAAIITARRYVLAAFLAFLLPAVVGFIMLREQPGLAAEVLPDVILARADQAEERMARGLGYAEVDPSSQAPMASWIISNNIRVAFACFAMGIFLGVGSLAALAFNGLSFGSVLGHFDNVGVLGYILRFVVGHGILELFAIWVAGGAGFLLGLSVIAPGRRTRGDALVLNGRLAIRMVGAVIIFLGIAGVIEGFVSAGGGGTGFRLTVSWASVVFLVLYLLNGARYLHPGATGSAAGGPARSRAA